MADPAKILSSDDAQPSAMQISINEFPELFLSCRCDQEDESGLARQKASSCREGDRVAVIATQPALVSGEQGLPFLAGDKRRSSTCRGAPVETSPSPRVTGAPGRDNSLLAQAEILLSFRVWDCV